MIFPKNKSCCYDNEMKPLALLSTFFKICLTEFTWRWSRHNKGLRHNVQSRIHTISKYNKFFHLTPIWYFALKYLTKWLKNCWTLHFKEDVIIFWGFFNYLLFGSKYYLLFIWQVLWQKKSLRCNLINFLLFLITNGELTT